MGKKYKIVALAEDGQEVDFYGGEIGEIIELDDKTNDTRSYVWCVGCPAFKEPGWTDIASYCVADNMKDFLKYVEEVV